MEFELWCSAKAGLSCTVSHTACYKCLGRRSRGEAKRVGILAWRLAAVQRTPARPPAPCAAVANAARARARQVIKREGVRALWRGNGVTIVHRLPYSAVNFWAYERFTEMWLHRYPAGGGGGARAPARAGSGRSDMLRRLAAGGAAGLCACTLVRPALRCCRPRSHQGPARFMARAGGAAGLCAWGYGG